jgi:hypothetical protein
MLVEWIKGRWYFCVTCRHCGSEFCFAKAEEPVSHVRRLTCSECFMVDEYGPDEFRKVEAK